MCAWGGGGGGGRRDVVCITSPLHEYSRGIFPLSLCEDCWFPNTGGPTIFTNQLRTLIIQCELAVPINVPDCLSASLPVSPLPLPHPPHSLLPPKSRTVIIMMGRPLPPNPTSPRPPFTARFFPPVRVFSSGPGSLCFCMRGRRE